MGELQSKGVALPLLASSRVSPHFLNSQHVATVQPLASHCVDAGEAFSRYPPVHCEKAVGLPLPVLSRVSPHVFGTHAAPEDVAASPLLAVLEQLMVMVPCDWR